MISCQAVTLKDPLSQYLDSSAGFSPDNLPNKLIRQITAEQVNLLGETHMVEEIFAFYQQMVPQVHAEGVRMIALELPVSASLFFDLYVRGEIPKSQWKVEEHGFLDHPLLETLRQYNQELRELNRADEQIRLVSFDVDWNWTQGYTWLVRYLRHVGLSTSFFQRYDQNLELLKAQTPTGLSEAIEAEFLWVSERTKLNFENFQVDSPLVIILQGKLGPEKSEFREGFMTENLRHYISQLSSDDKLLILTGSGHAMKQGTQAMKEIVSPNPLASRLQLVSVDKVNSTSFAVPTIGLPERSGIQSFLRSRFEIGEKDLYQELQTLHPDKWSWINLNTFPEGDYTGQIINPDDLQETYPVDFTKLYDGLIVIPQGEFNLPDFLIPSFLGQ